MPRRAPSPCTYPGCPALVERGGRCPAHRRSDASARARGRADYLARQKIYASRRWRGLRRTVLRAQPVCAAPGCHQLATDVDHVTPLGTWQGDPFDLANLQGLCRACHSRKTAGETWHRGVNALEG